MLKDIRDSLARPPRPNNNRDDNDDDDDNNNDDNDDDDDNDYDNRPYYNDDNNDDNDDDDDYDNRPYYNDDNDDNDGNYGSAFLNNIQNDGEHYARLIAYQNVAIGKLKEELTDKKNLTQDIDIKQRKL